MNRSLEQCGDLPHFLIVGTPRSGTTLLQRLTAELPGVSVTPETHFFSLFYDAALRGTRMPMESADVIRVIRQYAELPVVRELGIDAEVIADSLGGRCDSAWHLFGAVVDALAGHGHVVGEKTPNHLRWWRPLAAASPPLRIVAVVRDPRAVVASNLDVPFGMASPMLVAAQWLEDLRDLAAATRYLPSNRLLLLRYEDVLEGPAAAKRQIAGFLGVDECEHEGSGQDGGRPSSLFPTWESSWKARAIGPVDSSRAAAWRSRLSEEELRGVELVARRGMRWAGYQSDHHRLSPEAVRGFSPAELGRLAHFRWSRRLQRRAISQASVGGRHV